MDITQDQFDLEVLKADKPVLVDFWAPWCGPCKITGPILDEIAGEESDRLKIVKINVDENQQIAEQFNILSIPTMLVFKQGNKVAELIGAAPKATILAHLEAHLEAK